MVFPFSFNTLCEGAKVSLFRGKTTSLYKELQSLVHSPNQVTFSHNQDKCNVLFEGKYWSLCKTTVVNIHAVTGDVIKHNNLCTMFHVAYYFSDIRKVCDRQHYKTRERWYFQSLQSSWIKYTADLKNNDWKSLNGPSDLLS
jgi:hypothetical protein